METTIVLPNASLLRTGTYRRSGDPLYKLQDGYYWTAKMTSTANAYGAYFNYSYVYGGDYGDHRNNGHSLRCLAR